jgi:hypothetical protein
MADATDDMIRELQIMKRLIDIGRSPSSSGSAGSESWSGRRAWMALLVFFLYVRGNILLWVHPCMKQKVLSVDLAVIHIHAYDLGMVGLTRGMDLKYGCIYGLIQSHTVSQGIVRPFIRSYREITSVPGF